MFNLIRTQKNKILIIGLLGAVLISLILKFEKYIVQKDFYAYIYAPCDQQYKSCFEYEDEQYVKLYQKAYIVEQCMDESCDMYACTESQQEEGVCLVVECSEDVLEEGEVCVNNQEI